MRILIAEDDEALAQFVRQGLEAENYSVDILADGEQARTAATDVDYDLVILDLNLPKLDGVSVLRHLRLKKPSLPVLVLTQRNKVEDRIQCLDTGADDYVPKQMSATSLDIFHIREDLIAKIRAAAQSQKPNLPTACKKAPTSSSRKLQDTVATTPAIVAVGASTGGPRALQEVLPLLPGDLSVPVLIVQHMPAGFTAPFAQRLNALCRVRVREAIDNDRIEPGVVYIAPAGLHMTVQRCGDPYPCIRLDSQPADHLHIPSVDITMKSVARYFRNLAMGVILTGMGSDGAEGMRAIYREGGLTIGQDQASCAVYGMPRACFELGVLSRVVPLSQVPAQILHATHYRRRA
jgi:two-component system, chemotaxis family, protein-glutamate methylesterase/glutaminase